MQSLMKGNFMKYTWLIASLTLCLGASLAYAAKSEKKTEFTLSCPAQGIYLDGNNIKDTGKERLEISINEMNEGEKDGKPQIWTITDAKIISNDTTFKANIISHTPDYIVVGYGDLLKEGIGAHLVVANYIIDLKTKKMRRTLSLFPNGKDWSFEGQCNQI